MMYSVTNLQDGTTTSVYSLGSCDFSDIMDMLGKFAKNNKLEDCVLTIRDYEPDERREHEEPPATAEYRRKVVEAEKSGKNPKRYKKPSIKPVDPDHGAAYVVSFDWMVHKTDKAKQIEYRFYDEGWPGHVTVSKTPSAVCPTEIVFRCHNRDSGLQAKFKALLEESDIREASI